MWSIRGAKDFRAITRGIRRDVNQEFLMVGSLTLHEGVLKMRNPLMVIGSDRMELYEFFARRKETLLL